MGGSGEFPGDRPDVAALDSLASAGAGSKTSHGFRHDIMDPPVQGIGDEVAVACLP